jgi:hypothetical protein
MESNGYEINCRTPGRQLSLPGRSAGWDDLLFDALGIAAGVMLAGWLWRRVVSVAGVDQRH